MSGPDQALFSLVVEPDDELFGLSDDELVASFDDGLSFEDELSFEEELSDEVSADPLVEALFELP